MAVPGLVYNIVLQTGNGQNFLSWPIISGATSYKVNRSIDGVTFSTVGTPVTNKFLDSTVTVGTNYYYQVASTNGSGDSPFLASYPVNITPCLPGQINLGYLRYMSQLYADKLNSRFLTTDEWNFNINTSSFRLYNILVTNYGEDYFFAPPLQIPLTGLPSYPLPDGSNYNGAPAILKLNGVDANVSGASIGPNAGWVPLSRFNWSDRDKYTTFPGQAGALNNIYQTSYREMGNQLFIVPTNQNMLIQIWYVPIMIQLLQDTDMLPFSFTGWYEYILLDAASKAVRKEESYDQWNALQKDMSVIASEIESAAKNRDVGQPNTVSNVRSTMGDPGFSNWGNGYGGGGFGGGGSGY